MTKKRLKDKSLVFYLKQHDFFIEKVSGGTASYLHCEGGRIISSLCLQNVLMTVLWLQLGWFRKSFPGDLSPSGS